MGADGTVYVGSADFFFYAISPDGEFKWNFRTDRYIVGGAALSADGKVFRVSGKVTDLGEEEKLATNNLYAEGKSLSMAGSFYNIPLFGTPLAGTCEMNYLDLPQEAPRVFEVKRVFRQDGTIVAEYDNEAGILASHHHLSTMLIDKRSKEPVILDYTGATNNVSASNGLLHRTELHLPRSKSSRVKGKLDGAVIERACL